MCIEKVVINQYHPALTCARRRVRGSRQEVKLGKAAKQADKEVLEYVAGVQHVCDSLFTLELTKLE